MRFGWTTKSVVFLVGAGLIAGMAGGCSKKTPSAARDQNSLAKSSSVLDLPEVKALRAKAEEGDAEAQYYYGIAFGNQNGKELDYKEAGKWWTKAAEQGYAKAQSNLGFMYANGRGVAQDDVQAYKWTILAAAQGDEIAVMFKDTRRAKLSPSQVAEAERLAKEFKPRTRSGESGK